LGFCLGPGTQGLRGAVIDESGATIQPNSGGVTACDPESKDTGSYRRGPCDDGVNQESPDTSATEFGRDPDLEEMRDLRLPLIEAAPREAGGRIMHDGH
jgi:hypothetical protein